MNWRPSNAIVCAIHALRAGFTDVERAAARKCSTRSQGNDIAAAGSRVA
jgi:hypothetical protein